jgi:hypothetical protein
MIATVNTVRGSCLSDIANGCRRVRMAFARTVGILDTSTLSMKMGLSTVISIVGKHPEQKADDQTIGSEL